MNTLEEYQQEIIALRKRAERAEAAFLHEAKQRTDRPDFATFCELKHGPAGAILWALQNGEISRGKAAEALAEWAHGVEPQLPELPDAIPDDVVPLDLLRERDEARRQIADAQAEAERLRNEVHEWEESDAAKSVLDPIFTEEIVQLTAKVAELQAQNAHLREALSTLRKDFGNERMHLPINNTVLVERFVNNALATIEPAAEWLARQKKLAAADIYESWSRRFEGRARGYMRDSMGAVVCDELSREFGEKAAELRKEAGDV